MRHVLGVLGVLAAGVLLAVSAAMNWRFGFSLGRTELDGQIYGAASAAADVMKALIPFFFFAAVRNKVWSQAAASALVWVVVMAYSMTSALGHAALNRMDTSGQRAQEAQVYQDLRAELKRAEEQSAWIPQHRPYEAVQSAIDGLKTQKTWGWSGGCAKPDTKSERSFCQQYHALNAELAAAGEGKKAQARLDEIRAKIAQSDGQATMTESDPQAKVLADLAAIVLPGVSVENVQTALTVFVALLLEIGSGFGMYVAFSQWRLDGRQDISAAPEVVSAEQRAVAATAAVPALQPAAVEANPPRSIANDNRSIDIEPVTAPQLVLEAPAEQPAEAAPSETKVVAIAKHLVPESDTERYYRECVVTQEGETVTAHDMYDDYCSWCEAKNKEAMTHPSFNREFGELGVKKERIKGRIHWVGIALRSQVGLTEVENSTAKLVDAA